jgi:hypothetical protein
VDRDLISFAVHTDIASGDLQSVDGYMNIALERCKEMVDGKVVRSWGDAFVRGNNGMLFILYNPLIYPNTYGLAVTYISADNA